MLEDEWEAYRDLRLRALETDPLAFGSTAQRERAFSPETWKDRVGGRSNPLGSASWAAVTARGRFVGMTVAAEFEGAVRLFAMWVDPEYREQGVGGRLVDAALNWVRGRFPGRAVVLEVNPRQTAAVRLYESRGFCPTGKSSPLGHTPGESTVEMVRSPRTDAPPM